MRIRLMVWCINRRVLVLNLYKKYFVFIVYGFVVFIVLFLFGVVLEVIEECIGF